MNKNISGSLTPRYLMLALFCVLLAVAYTGSSYWIDLYIAMTLTAIAGCIAAIWRRTRILADDGELFSLPLAIAHDPEILDLYRSVNVAFRDLSANLDPIYRELAVDRARQLSQEAATVARGQIVFHGNEAWRRAYEKLLRSRGLYRYRSVHPVQKSFFKIITQQGLLKMSQHRSLSSPPTYHCPAAIPPMGISIDAKS